MRANEPVDVIKWAISALLLCLLIGTVLALFYMLYDNTDRRIANMQKAATSSNMDRLYDLQDNSLTNAGNVHKYPLCSNVVSALTEFNEEDLLYIAVIPPSDVVEAPYVFTYEGTSLSVPGYTVDMSQIPVTVACRYLLSYSDCRAELSLGKYDINTGASSMDMNSPGLLYVQVALYRDTVIN